MTRAFIIKNKARMVLALAVLTAMLLLANWNGRDNVKALDKTLTSIMNDRLMPATFVHEISNRLYENKLTSAMSGSDIQAKINHNYAAIEILAKKYEATQLTREESAKWKTFRTQLSNLRNQETDKHSTEYVFAQALKSLDQLIAIQVGESNRLLQSGQKNVSSSILTANFGAVLCVVLVLFIMVLLSAREQLIFRRDEHHLLN
ncbi:MCP four helix bundle domain-containing protein [Mucilaginibacter sp. SMC90]|uniref:MCP four helix bundle domain-containing protein n=1 Tax=Mucilaginibacter sp. SMC90 TaxID=2929803 RepID=UPI001FB4CACF|nr:MCP four helix bundle domain-containing protein [Mucilaginibacter sp. SMC90]UOE52314.1 MCP four helix bundle domain-containing protein [Mucilaginibacter sp. SMC90]